MVSKDPPGVLPLKEEILRYLNEIANMILELDDPADIAEIEERLTRMLLQIQTARRDK